MDGVRNGSPDGAEVAAADQESLARFHREESLRLALAGRFVEAEASARGAPAEAR